VRLGESEGGPSRKGPSTFPGALRYRRGHVDRESTGSTHQPVLPRIRFSKQAISLSKRVIINSDQFGSVQLSTLL
jgi:hypothetical protein